MICRLLGTKPWLELMMTLCAWPTKAHYVIHLFVALRRAVIIPRDILFYTASHYNVTLQIAQQDKGEIKVEHGKHM